MNLIPDELKMQTFPCPSCGNYINDELDVCKFCKVRITNEMRAGAIEKERAERKRQLLGREKNVIVLGLVTLGVGLINVVTPFFDFYLTYSSGLRVPCLSTIAFVFGSGVALFGLRGYLREKNS